MIKNKPLTAIFFMLITFILIPGCSSYKTSWDCAKAHGIGCSSIEYADEVAREQIILNKTNSSTNKILITHNAFESQESQILEFEEVQS